MIIYLGGAATALAAGEILLRLQNPYRLWKDAFDEGKVHKPDSDFGWRPIPDISFRFYHRYLKGKRLVRHNSLGLRSSREFSPQKEGDVFRILVFGETTLLGWELEERQTICSLLEKKLQGAIPAKRVEVVPVVARNYCLGQLYTWYHQIFHDFDFDLLIYYFNENNPRRSITFHESGKPAVFTQPIFVRSPQGDIKLQPAPMVEHPNDMVFLNAQGEVNVERGITEKSLHNWLKNHLHLYCALDDLKQGAIRLRDFKDRVEIKDIEKWKQRKEMGGLPFQWEICRAVFLEWEKMLSISNRPMVLVNNLQYYHAGNNWLQNGTEHPWGFDYEDIPSRKYLSAIAEEMGVEFWDTYQHAFENKVDTSDFYIHPRYAYYSPSGAAYQATYIAQRILNFW
jgi:hypothetical protein